MRFGRKMGLEEMARSAAMVVSAGVAGGVVGAVAFSALTNTLVYFALTSEVSKKSPEELKKDIETFSLPLISSSAPFHRRVLIYAGLGFGAWLARNKLQRTYDQRISEQKPKE